jgi:polyferredoxin
MPAPAIPRLRIRQAPRRQRLRKSLLLVSLLLFPLTLYYFSPYLVFQGAALGVVTGSLLMFGLLFVSALFVGRLWCGWLCPGGAVGEFCQPMNEKRMTNPWVRRLKWLIWAPWVAGIVLTFWLAGGVRSVQPLFGTTWGISVAEPAGYVIFYGVLATFVVLALVVGRRAGCHTICWMAPFLILGRNVRNAAGWPALRLVADPERCTQCTTCATHCPMSLDVHTMVQAGRMEDPNCILCGSCVDGCHKHAIRFVIAPGDGPRAAV